MEHIAPERKAAPQVVEQAGSGFFGQEAGSEFSTDGRPETAQLKQLQAAADASPQVQQFRELQQNVTDSPMQQEAIQRKGTLEQHSHVPLDNRGGLPDGLRSGIEQLSGMDMGDVRVHRNSGKAGEAGALAYAQGSDIHLAPGQEQHLPHEAWHVVQQRQGRVQPTTQAPNGAAVNDDAALEAEADAMGAKAMQMKAAAGKGNGNDHQAAVTTQPMQQMPIQRMFGGDEEKKEDKKRKPPSEEKVETPGGKKKTEESKGSQDHPFSSQSDLQINSWEKIEKKIKTGGEKQIQESDNVLDFWGEKKSDFEEEEQIQVLKKIPRFDSENISDLEEEEQIQVLKQVQNLDSENKSDVEEEYQTEKVSDFGGENLSDFENKSEIISTLLQNEEIILEDKKEVPSENQNDTEELGIDESYWIRAVVRDDKDNKNCAPKNLHVRSITISPERRTTKRDKEQGDHIVAWSLAYRYWQAHLSGTTLDVVIDRLEDLLIQDQALDTINDNTPTRQEAIARIQSIRDGKANASQCITWLEEAISYFIQANQASSFAIHGKASGGKSEGESRRFLEDCNKKPTEISGKAKEINAKALNLIDNDGKNLPEEVRAKAVTTWYNALRMLFPEINQAISNWLLNEKIGNSTVAEHVKTWNEKMESKDDFDVTSKTEDYKNSLETLEKHTIKLTPDDHNARTGVFASVGPASKDGMTPILAKDAMIKKLEIPDVLRAKTQYYPEQGAHTLAWTFERQSLERRFGNKSAADGLILLLELVEHDLKHAGTLGRDSFVLEEFSSIQKKIKEAGSMKMTLQEWNTFITTQIQCFIEANQRLSSTTYKAGGKPTGHAEGTSNDKFSNPDSHKKENESQLGNLDQSAARYMDLGIVYLEALADFRTYSTLRSKVGYYPLELYYAQGGKDCEEINEKMQGFKSEKKETKIEKEVQAEKKSPDEVLKALVGLERWSQKHSRAAILNLQVVEQDNLDSACEVLSSILELETETDPKKVQTYNENCQLLSDQGFPSYKLNELTFGVKDKKDRLIQIRKEINSIQESSPEFKTKLNLEFYNLWEKLKDPEAYVPTLINGKKAILKKVVEDFTGHMKYFHAPYSKHLEKDGNLKKVVSMALKAPFDEKDNMIAGPLKNFVFDHKACKFLLDAMSKGVDKYTF